MYSYSGVAKSYLTTPPAKGAHKWYIWYPPFTAILIRRSVCVWGAPKHPFKDLGGAHHTADPSDPHTSSYAPV